MLTMKHLVVLLTLMLGLTNCKKNNSTSLDIDTSKVYYTDFAGNPFYSDTLDGQWKSKNFDSRETSLFTV